jgi:hypothetical protein
MGQSIPDAIQPGQVQSSTDHNKENYTTVQVYHPWPGIEQRQLRQEPRFEHP